MSEDRPEPESDDGWGPTDSVDADRPEGGDDGSRADDEEDDRKSKTGRIPIDLDRRATGRDGRATDRDGRATDGIDDGDDEDEYGPEPRSTPIEPGTPTLEHAVFVVLGALAMIAVVLRMASITI